MQIQRLFEIIYILLERKTVTAAEFADYFEVSKRTIYRDIETLSSAKIPIYMTKGKGGGISLLPSFVLDRTTITKEEQEAILTALRTINAVEYEKTKCMEDKLSHLFQMKARDWIEVDFATWSNHRNQREMFQLIKQAILSKHVLSFIYTNTKGECNKRVVEPLKLCFRGDGWWYLYAYCKLREDFRFFKLTRIHEMKLGEETFLRECEDNISKDKGEYPSDEMVNVSLRIHPSCSFRVYDEFETYELDDKGYFLINILLPKGEWLYSYIMSYGTKCEVLAPEDIRKRVVLEYQNGMGLYGK